MRLREKGLDSFAETGVGCHVQVCGNMAVALAGREMVEGGTGSHETSRASCW